jgi:transcriptional regulator with XRE-family HTH domain
VSAQQPTVRRPDRAAARAYEKAWSQKWRDELTAANAAGDRYKARKIRFGRRICELRLLLGITRGEAANAADMDPGQWSRIENAKHIPYPKTVSKIADVLHVDDVGLLRIAGHVVPEGSYGYDEKAAMRDCGRALRLSNTQVEWLTRCQQIWQKYYLEQTRTTVDIKMQMSYSEIVEFIYQYLGREQQLKLARRLIRQYPLDEAKEFIKTPERLLDEVESQLQGEIRDGEGFLESSDQAIAAINALLDRVQHLYEDPQKWLNRIEEAVRLIPEKRRQSAYIRFALVRRPKIGKLRVPIVNRGGSESEYPQAKPTEQTIKARVSEVFFEHVWQLTGRLSASDQMRLARYIVDKGDAGNKLSRLTALPVPATTLAEHNPSPDDRWYVASIKGAVDVIRNNRIIFQVRFNSDNLRETHLEIRLRQNEPSLSEDLKQAIRASYIEKGSKPPSEKQFAKAHEKALSAIHKTEIDLITDEIFSRLPNLTRWILEAADSTIRTTIDDSVLLFDLLIAHLFEHELGGSVAVNSNATEEEETLTDSEI